MSGEDCYINYCKIIGDVIKHYIDNITRERGITREAAYWIIDEHIKSNSEQWRSGLKPKIPYEDPLCRIAYLYSIVPVNANLVEYVFGADPELQNYFDNLQKNKGSIDICAFGGGPGTEMLGLAKRIEKIWRNGRQENQLVLDFLLLDQVKEWLDSWRLIKQQIESRFRDNIGIDQRKWPLAIRGDSSGIDIMETANFGNLVTIFNQDIYILSYIVSEIFKNLEILQSFTTKMAAHAPRGSKFLFIDRKEEQWKNAVKEIASKAKITLSDFHDINSSFSGDEEKTDLGEICKYVSRSPRTTCRAFWVVGTKN